MTEEFLGRREDLAGEVGGVKEIGNRLSYRRVVIEDEDDRIAGGNEALTGKTNWNVAPRPGLCDAHSRPPRASMIERLIPRPMPRPSDLVV